MKLELTPEALDLSLDEIEAIEDIVDAPASTWGDIKQGRLIKAIVFTVRHRSEPDLTIEDVGAIKLSELEDTLRPTGAGD